MTRDSGSTLAPCDTGDMPLTWGPATRTLCQTVGHCNSHLGTQNGHCMLGPPKGTLETLWPMEGTQNGPPILGVLEALNWRHCGLCTGDIGETVLGTLWTLYWGHRGYCTGNTEDPVLRTLGTLGWAVEHCDRHGGDPKWSPCAGATGPVLGHGVIVGESQHGHPMGHLCWDGQTLHWGHWGPQGFSVPPPALPPPRVPGVSGVPGGDVTAAPAGDAVRRV